MDRALIDTDILSYYFKGDPNVRSNFDKYLDHYDVIEVSIITYYEVTSGLLAKSAFKQLDVFEEFIVMNNLLPLTKETIKRSAEVYSTLRRAGNTVDDIDLLIAGVAMENEMTLVTNNDKHFSRIPGIKLQNWKEYLL